MRILLANKYFYARGGDCVYTIALKDLLEKNGHKVAMFSMQHPKNFNSEFDFYWPSNVEYGEATNKNLIEKIVRPIYSAEVKKAWLQIIRDFNPDVVHLNNIHTQLSPLLAELAYKNGIPVFWTLHDFKLICPAYSFLRNGEICEDCLSNKLSVVKHKCIKNNFLASILGYTEAQVWSREKLENYTSKFICPSKFLKNKMQSAGFDASKMVHLSNFAKAEKINPFSEREDYYVYLGRLSQEKGIETLLQVATTLNYRLKVIGDGPLSKIMREKYSTGNIEFMGHCTWETIQPILMKARFMLIPTECYENNPLSVIEAHTLGTPVLGGQIGGIPELIRENENGMLFQAANKEDLKNKIEQMMAKNDWNYNNIANVSMEKYSGHAYYQKLIKLYQAAQLN